MPDAPSGGPTRTELEVLWRSKLMQAQRDYSCASAKWHEALRTCEELGIPGADGTLAINRAAQAEATARCEYARVLTIFMDLVVRGKIPPME